jgi:hypothetical protein
MHVVPMNPLRLTRDTLRQLEDRDAFHIQGGGFVAPMWTRTPHCPQPDPIPNPW